ncbi:hypothetical protein [Oceanispirochaeta crateris]|nr:hypothetical protein [Oceanispirochaeta crateris]
MEIALEEIETTSREAAREAVAEEAGKTAYYKALAERERQTLKQKEYEIQRLQRRCLVLGFTNIGSALLLGGGWTADRIGLF